MKPETITKLHDFIDAFEEEYGEVEGFEISLEHPVIEDEGARQGFASIKEFVVKTIVRSVIEVNPKR